MPPVPYTCRSNPATPAQEDWSQVGPAYESQRRPRVTDVQVMTDRPSPRCRAAHLAPGRNLALGGQGDHRRPGDGRLTPPDSPGTMAFARMAARSEARARYPSGHGV